MRLALAACISLISLAWSASLLTDPALANASAPWVVRQEALYLTGLLSFGLMSIAMVLATGRHGWKRRSAVSTASIGCTSGSEFPRSRLARPTGWWSCRTIY